MKKETTTRGEGNVHGILGTEPHELFLPEGPDDTLIFPAWISVIRTKPVHDTTGGCIPASELPDVKTLHSRFGGGSYEVVARDQRKVILARRKVGPLPGPAKPMYLGAPGEETDYESQQSPPMAAAVAAAHSPQTVDPVLLEILRGMQQQGQALQELVKQSNSVAAAAVQGLQNVQSVAKDTNDKMFTVLTNALTARTELPLQVAKASAEKDTSIDHFMSGMEFAKTIIGESSQKDDLGETIQAITGGIKAWSEMQSSRGGPGPSSTSSPPVESEVRPKEDAA